MGETVRWHETVSNILSNAKNRFNVKTIVNSEKNTLTLDYTTRQRGLNNYNYRGKVDGHVDQFVSELSGIYKKRTGGSLTMHELNRDDRLLYYGKTGGGDHFITHTRVYQYDE